MQKLKRALMVALIIAAIGLSYWAAAHHTCMAHYWGGKCYHECLDE